MRASNVLLCLSVLGWASCASTSSDGAGVSATPNSSAAPAAGDDAAARAVDATFSAGVVAVAPPPRRPEQRDLSIWKDPSFQKRFAESYIAETDIEPTVNADERDVMLQVLELLSSDELEQAAALIEENRSGRASAVFDFTLANIRFQQERFDDAAAACRAAVEKHPKFRRAWQLLGQIAVQENRFEDALPALTRVIALGGGNALTYGMLGFAHANLGNHLSAETGFRMAVLLDPETMDWKLGLADTLFRQQRYGDAAAFFGSLIAENPDRPELWLAQGEAYARLGEPLKAAENFEMVDRLGGSTPDSLANLGDIYANQELFDLAVDAYLRALNGGSSAKVDRAIRAARFMCANGALAETRTLLDGIEHARGGEFDDATRKDVLRLRARVALAEGEGDEQAQILEEIVRLDPLDGDALILLGQHAGRNEDPDKAIFYFERAANIEGFEADAKVRHAQLLVGLGRYTEAIPLLRRAQELEPRDNVKEYLEQVERVAQSR